MRFVKDNTNFDFVKLGKIGSFFSLALVIVSFFTLAFRGVNLGIDFAGGVLVEFSCPGGYDNVTDVRKDVSSFSENSVIYATDSGYFVVKSKINPSASSDALGVIKRVLTKGCNGSIDYRRTDYVGSQVSGAMLFQGAMAIIAALFGVMAYLCARFNFYFAVGGIVTLLHDIVLLLGFYAVTQLEFNLSSVAVLLTIVGYSINDSVVIYDSVRDSLKKMRNIDLKLVVNSSINRTLSRTIFTSFTTLLAAMVLVIMSNDVLRPFSWSILFGLVVGTYSSIAISAQCLIWLQQWRGSKILSTWNLPQARDSDT